TAVVPLGGDHITNDIAVGLRTPSADAEELKKVYGCAQASLVLEDETVEVPSIGGRQPPVLSRPTLPPRLPRPRGGGPPLGGAGHRRGGARRRRHRRGRGHGRGHDHGGRAGGGRVDLRPARSARDPEVGGRAVRGGGEPDLRDRRRAHADGRETPAPAGRG